MKIFESDTWHLVAATQILHAFVIIVFHGDGLVVAHCFVHVGGVVANAVLRDRDIRLLPEMLLVVLPHVPVLLMAGLRLHVDVAFVLHLGELISLASHFRRRINLRNGRCSEAEGLGLPPRIRTGIHEEPINIWAANLGHGGCPP